MGSALLAARILLAVVFVVASVGKLLDLRGSRATMVDFGVPESLSGWAGTALPIAELVVAVALLVQPAALWGAGGALALLAAFTGGIVHALTRGETPDCHCFGQIQSAPVGRGHIVRNLVLSALAVFVVADGPGSGFGVWLSARGATDAVAVGLGVAVIALLAATLALGKRNQELSKLTTSFREFVSHLPIGLPVGSVAPSFEALDVDGNPFTLDELRLLGRPIALIFGTPGCGPCSILAPEALRWRQTLGDRVTVGLVGIGTYLRFEAAAQQRPIRAVAEEDGPLADELGDLEEVLSAYRARATPSAVLVSPEGTIASATVDGRLAIIALLHRAADGAIPTSNHRQPVAA